MPRHHGEADDDETGRKLAEVGRTERGETVRIVDDEPSVRMLVAEVLEDLGYTAIEAADSVAGLKVLRSDAHRPAGHRRRPARRHMADAARERRPDL